MDFRDVRDESVDDVINHVLRALHNPRHVSSTGSANDLHHLLVEFGPLIPPATAEDPVIDLIETIVRESTPANSSAPSTSHSLHESPSILSTDSRRGFWSKLFKRKSQKSTEGFQDPAEGSHDPAEPSKYSLPSIGSANDSSASASALKAAENHVAQLEDSGPGDLSSVSALGREINRRICVWSSSMTLRHEVGSGRPGDPINVQFHSQPEDIIGHWSLIGNEDPQNTTSGLNDCLFNAIAAQTGHKPSELRDITVARMRTNIRSVANRIRELARREECDRIVLMVGGARYHGSTARDAGRVIDNSQRGRSHPNHASGHPRGHASNPSATGPNDSAENYSRNGWKTAFLSLEDQDDVGNRVLRTRQVQRAMEALNAGGVRQVVRVDASEVEGQLPQGAHFNDGRRGQVQEIRDLVLVLQHHAGHQRDPDYDVFVHTFYPVLRG
ncbi:uncharacterized protein LOC130677371 [Microplitis mediator]|uniref:uncharacterized protein LOC130677371 n=1 Tax=Microplitis mediator TaxID=375433 RepID=UPI0025574EB4|nr:uncharacterized protein LOC130677371 [Microplitis mediator]